MRSTRRNPSRQLLIFVPEGRRLPTSIPVDVQDRWVVNVTKKCADLFGGATAYGRGVGAWREGDVPEAVIHWDRITVVECWINPNMRDWKKRLDSLFTLLHEMRVDLQELVIACILDGEWIPLEGNNHAGSR